MLSWAVTGADELELRQDDTQVFESRSQPLPNRRKIDVCRTARFVLKATTQLATADGGTKPQIETRAIRLEIDTAPEETPQ